MGAGSVFRGPYCLLSHPRSKETDPSVKVPVWLLLFWKHAGKGTPYCNSMNSSLKQLSQQIVSCFFSFLLASPGYELDPLGTCKNFVRSQKYHSVVEFLSITKGLLIHGVLGKNLDSHNLFIIRGTAK